MFTLWNAVRFASDLTAVYTMLTADIFSHDCKLTDKITNLSIKEVKYFFSRIESCGQSLKASSHNFVATHLSPCVSLTRLHCLSKGLMRDISRIQLLQQLDQFIISTYNYID